MGEVFIMRPALITIFVCKFSSFEPIYHLGRDELTKAMVIFVLWLNAVIVLIQMESLYALKNKFIWQRLDVNSYETNDKIQKYVCALRLFVNVCCFLSVTSGLRIEPRLCLDYHTPRTGSTITKQHRYMYRSNCTSCLQHATRMH